MNCGSVVTRKSLQAKLAFMSPHVFPLFSVLDPEKTYTLPLRQISNGPDLQAQLKAPGMVGLGERREITLDVSRKILELSL